MSTTVGSFAPVIASRLLLPYKSLAFPTASLELARKPMDPQLFDDLQQSLAKEGPAKAIEHLCTMLRERKDYTNLFYALLMKKRFEMGVSPVPAGASQDLPTELHTPYEDAIREAGRVVGQ